MDIGIPVRRRIVVPKVPARRQPAESDAAAPPDEPVRIPPARERRTEPV